MNNDRIIQDINNAINEYNWDILNDMDVETGYKYFINEILNITNNLAPEKNLKYK